MTVNLIENEQLGMTALMFASKNGHPQVVNQLLVYNAEIDLKDKVNSTFWTSIQSTFWLLV